jgi:multidrug efflux pump subunit AcrA (membrane-fusion protein)
LLYAQTELHAAQVDVERVEAELADKRAALEARSQALLQKAERALAYAKVYAQGDDELVPRLAEIGRKRSTSANTASQSHSSPGLISAPGPKRRGRKLKTEEAPEDLFNESASVA